MTISIFSFFSGAGFLDLGFETEGYSIEYVNEIHSPFLNAYKYARTKLRLDEPSYGYFDGDIADLLTRQRLHLSDYIQDARIDANIIGFIGGPPCPDFSVGGKNRGRHGDQGQLSEAYFDLILQQVPDFFVYENVKGLWRTTKHRAFYEEMKHRLHQGNYVTTESLINSIEFGTPQDRDRIILLGFHKNLLRNLRIPIKDEDITLNGAFPWRKNVVYDRDAVFSLNWPDANPFVQNETLLPPTDIIQDLTVECWFRRNRVSEHPNAKHHFIPRAALKRFLSINEGDVSKKSFKRLHRWRYSPTAAYGNNEVHIHPYKARRISAAEAMAIQSLPKEFALPPYMTLSDMFKTIGNGVPYLASKGLAKTLRDFLRVHNQWCKLKSS
jgi:DNA (cytosine-5)-methyltransferase 1